MESKYREMLLLRGLDNITDEELDRFKFFIPDEFTIAKSKLQTANRTELANLLIQNAGVVPAVTKTIRIFQKLNYMHVAKSLQDEKAKVDDKYMGNKKTKEASLTKRKSLTEVGSVASAVSGNDAGQHRVAPAVSPHGKPLQKQVMARQESAREEGLQKDGLIVMVLKATKPFEFETQDGRKQEMFHATVATEKEFFFVKVFNMQLKDKFAPRRTIIISKYCWHSGFLEVNSASLIVDAKSDQEINVPPNIIRKAGETPKINKLQTQPLGTIVNGLFVIQKKTEKRDLVLFDVSDNTGNMEVLVFKKQNQVNCEEGDKLRLTFFELSKSGEKLQLKSGVHSFLTVVKAKK
uniref:Interferon-inducible protein AIM2 n=1 Tax=Spermophilus dauricus TaxID=99837 RepID=A0A8C9QCR1_SPEDA